MNARQELDKFQKALERRLGVTICYPYAFGYLKSAVLGYEELPQSIKLVKEAIEAAAEYAARTQREE